MLDEAVPATTVGVPRPAPPPHPWRTRLYRWDVKGSPYAYIAPFFLCFAAFGLFPLIYTAWVSLHSVDLQTSDQLQWRGFGNYTRLLHDDLFWNALRNTFTIGVMSTVPQLLMALGLAHLLNYRLRGRTFLRIAMLAPYATSIAAATLVFSLLFGRDYGMINWLLGQVGIGHIDWEAGTWSSQIAVSTIVTWRWTGYNALIYLAAMQAVPHDLYEAAALDGASRWQQFRHVTVPAIRPTVLFTVLVSTIGATQLFGEPLLFGGSTGHSGGSAHQYQTLGLYLYDQGWYSFHLGRAAAVAWTMLLLLLAIGAVNLAFARYRRAKEGS
ncbi:ABC transporter permease [Kitasatospora sp. MMS16-BH015]|uniref:carbohydrate ABC transporter permease n=1 Tax=Kitasatospora sp. MMS16-BH015 TaxID=2018025 RepID=UPI000CA28F57|nr:sugar ABC transporter permease [Kitasatospora sp. MMS16-BH015]AUG81849.1 ABC transporter permease [Kitasatospora sp. MMS16-BH015]